MPTPSHQPADLTRLFDTNLQPRRRVAAIERMSLLSEYRETIRRLLQHMVFALLLAIRLYMLPLLYISHKLSVHDDPWYPAIWDLILRPGRTLANCRRCRKRNDNVTVWKALANVGDGLFAPVRIFGSLYALARMIGEDPNALQSGPFPQPNADTIRDVDDRSKDEGSVEDQGTGSSNSTLEAPVSASQIYHAALLSNSTLDDLLAAFEADRDNQAMGGSRVRIGHGRNAYLSAVPRDAAGQIKPQQYRSLSIRSTPEAVLAAGKADEPFRSRDIQSSPQDFQPPKSPDKRANACLVQDQGEVQEGHESPKNSPELHTSIYTRYLPEVQQPDGGLDALALDRCPTFVRRQAQSRLPRRSESKDKQALAMLKARGAVSTPELTASPPTPTKRVRLQRRVRPRKNVVNASND
ncbi:uncharacterized protein Z520_06401 [Fonsecaea multimorphosa CBS 102226]|uniref:Uncharacterized protein n=1 Tax=Fonsecaea multimorphosa CBS 102226 TaxID=1442371 RepID=A0A0D2KLQ1_9EURO|nr:uncharacterized protein Z520_06401 [Fonsecaea multimorphosa CBS 102226]KIX97623.1 hypothetical protein Z520_06401 [Fonsecaea multimorphosa CBS 102226]OAL24086.1 hypothetical protein AYO22_05968 [Fonsecaea multimorphosa]